MLVNECGIKCNLTLLDTGVCAILVHPYALLGGSQQDHVIQNVKHYFQSKNMSTLTFNLTASYGFAAINSDVSKVVELSLLMKTKYKIDHIILVGYSYGSIVALEAAIQIDLHSVISISYPSQATLKQNLKLLDPSLPKLLIIGSTDNFSSVSNWTEFLSDLKCNGNNFIVLDGVDHFYSGQNDLEKLIDCIDNFWNKLTK